MQPTLIAPFWDDLNPNTGGKVSFAVLGEESNRELVIEWRDVPHCPSTDAATFQVVFFAGSPNMLFSYADVDFTSPGIDFGASATVGVQVAPGIAQQYSSNAGSLRNERSLLWAMGDPIAAGGPHQVVVPGAPVVLDGSASDDPDGSIVARSWSQVSGTPVELSSTDTAVTSFIAPEEPGS